MKLTVLTSCADFIFFSAKVLSINNTLKLFCHVIAIILKDGLFKVCKMYNLQSYDNFFIFAIADSLW